MELKTIEFEVDAPLATIRLNRPHRLNAWTGRMQTEYRWALDQAEADDSVRVIIVTGNGRGFCAGADTGALEGHSERGAYDDGVRETLAEPGYGVRPEFDNLPAFHFGLTKPVIAAINGPAAGMGLVLACFADIRFAASGAKLTTAHGKLNVPAEFGLSWLLPRLIGASRATELLLSSRIFLAEEAAAMGLVTAVYPAQDLLGRTTDYARSLASQVSRRSLRETKRQIYTDLHRDVGASVSESVSLLREMVTEPDFARGVEALAEKRSPDFQ